MFMIFFSRKATKHSQIAKIDDATKEHSNTINASQRTTITINPNQLAIIIFASKVNSLLINETVIEYHPESNFKKALLQ